MSFSPTPEERAAIRALKRLAARWPETLWLFCGGGPVYIMRLNVDGERAETKSGGVDPEFVLDTVNLPNDGGDW